MSLLKVYFLHFYLANKNSRVRFQIPCRVCLVWFKSFLCKEFYNTTSLLTVTFGRVYFGLSDRWCLNSLGGIFRLTCSFWRQAIATFVLIAFV